MLEYVVKLKYFYFKFSNKEDAAIFAEIAAMHAMDDDFEISINIERTLKDDTKED